MHYIICITQIQLTGFSVENISLTLLVAVFPVFFIGLYSSSSELDCFLFLPRTFPLPFGAAGAFLMPVSESESQRAVSDFLAFAGAFLCLGAVSAGFLAGVTERHHLNRLEMSYSHVLVKTAKIWAGELHVHCTHMLVKISVEISFCKISVHLKTVCSRKEKKNVGRDQVFSTRNWLACEK